MLEVCIDSFESAVNAIRGGADELEVCSSLSAGGLTPSPGLVKQILNMVNKLSPGAASEKTVLLARPKVNVMLRCREGWDFCYSQKEIDTMLEDLQIFKEMGVDRFVFGALTDSQEVDVGNCSKIITAAETVPVTFHRAFDMSKDPVSALSTIINVGFNRVLTSGQRPSAGEDKAVNLIKRLLDLYGDKIEVMAGAGVTAKNGKTFIDFGCKIIHSTCKTKKKLPKVERSLDVGCIDYIYVTDENVVRNLKELINA